MTINEERLANLNTLVLGYGAHEKRDVGMCATEAVAWLAGEPHSDHPKCLCPVIGEIFRTFNDRCGTGKGADARRTRVLGPILALAVGSRSTPAVVARRRYAASDWSIRSAVPRLLRVCPALAAWANRLEALPEIVSESTLKAARTVLYAATGAAWAERSEAYSRLRTRYTATAAADAAADAADATAAADAADAAAATAAADAADAAAATAATAAADAADAAAATAAADAADAAAATAAAAAAATAAATATAAADAAAADAATAADLRRIFDAALAARQRPGTSWSDWYAAARAVADEVFAGRASPFAALRDTLDDEFAILVRKLIEIRA